MKNLLLSLICWVILLNPQQILSQTQSAINNSVNYSSVYDFMNQYFNSPTYQPSNNEGETDEYIKKTFRLWGKSLHPTGDFSIAAQAITNYANNYSFSASSYNPDWISLGPSEDPYGSQSGVGQIHRIAFDPNYDGVTNQTIYAGTGFGGLWKTIDNGLNWISMNTDTQLPITSVSGIAVNPTNTSNIFISTGDGDGGFGLQFGPNSGFPNPVSTVGVYRTTDDGQNWESINNGLLSNFSLSGIIREMRMNPSNPDEIILASSAGVIKTANATSAIPTWAVEFTGIGINPDQQFRGIEYKPGDPSIIYASGEDIYKYDGATWSSMTQTYPGLDFSTLPNAFTPVRINIAVTPADPNMLYAYIYGTETSNIKKVYVYVFKNNLWTKIYEAYGSGITNIALNWLPIAVSPVNANEYYFGFTKVFGTSDYLTISEQDVSDYTTSGFHADVHALEFCPNMANPDLFAGTHGGVNFLPQPSAPNPISRWERKYKGLSVSLIWAFDNSEYDKRKIIGKQDLGVSIFSPTTSAWSTITGGDGYATRIDDEYPDEVYLTTNSYFTKTNFSLGNIYGNEPSRFPIDYFEQTATNVPQTFPMINHPQTGELWFGFSELYRRKKREIVSGDVSSDIWEVESGNYAIPNHSAKWQRGISELVIAESNPNYIYLATTGVDNGFNGPNTWQLNPLLLRSTTGGSGGNPSGTNFTEITTNLPNIYSGATDYPVITGIAVNPADEKELWVTFAGYDPSLKVWHSVDAGDNWSNYDLNGDLPNLSVNAIVYQDGTDDILYIGTDVGVYVKEGQNGSWEKYGDFPNVRVTEMKINNCLGKLDVATYGRGLWEGDLLPSGSYSGGRIIAGTETWTGKKSVKSNLIIPNGATLTITGILNMPKNGKIIVEQGGRLIVNGGTITNQCGQLWHGIEVQGDMNESQFTNGAQGYLEIKNGALIENSRFAAHASKHYDANGNFIWGSFGGIIKVSNSTFKNNVYGIDFGPYQNFIPSNPLLTKKDFSFVLNTTFTWDDNGNMVALGIKPYHHISMWNNHGIVLAGNKFRNDASYTTYSEMSRGIGLVTYDSEYSVVHQCNSTTFPCSTFDNTYFGNLTYGIKAENSNSFNSPVIKNADFFGCLRGIYLKNVDYAEIVNNSFDIASEFLGNPSYGIYFDNCNGYEVEENNFLSIAGNATYGIYTKASGTTANEIYNNQLNNLQIANQTEGVNGKSPIDPIPNGLVFRCNQNTTIATAEIAVTTGVVNKNQGNCGTALSPANNLFSGTAVNDIWLSSSMPFMDYFYSSSNAQLVPTATFPPGAVNAQPCFLLPSYNQSLNCPPRQQVVSNPTGLLADISNLNLQLQTTTSVIDNGSTKSLLGLINSTAPDWQIRNELMAASPYLSEEVLVALLLKSPALPNWVIQQVLIANAPLTDKVFMVMLQRTPALPDYLVHQLAMESSPLSSTEQLTFISRTPALPDWVITPVMIENSPLFDEVLIALMERTPKIADWSIRNIFVRNTPLSEDVESIMNTKNYPNWLINNINNSPFVAGEAIEKPQPTSPLLKQYNEISVLEQTIQLTENELFRTYLHDTTGTYGLADVIAYLDQNNDCRACDIKLSAAFIKNKEHQKAQTKIDSLRQDTTLTDFCDFHTALNELCQLTPSVIDTFTNAGITQTVTHVANSPQAGREKAGAETLLQFAGLGNFLETFEPLSANLRTGSKEGQPAPGTIQILNSNYKDDLIKVYPNPNNGNFYLDYHIDGLSNGYFILTDISGKEMWRKTLTKSNETVTVNLSQNTPPGMYLYQIVVNDEVFTIDKLIITQ